MPSVFTYEPLNASLADLRVADKKGKWWLVGSAWTGDPSVDAKHISATAEHPESRPAPAAEETLLKLARKQGMNTEMRRSIFAVLMSSEVRDWSLAGLAATYADDSIH